MLRRAAIASVLLLLLSTASTAAATTRIDVPALHYPASTTVAMGDTVNWVNTNPSSLVSHTVSSNLPFAQFNLSLPFNSSVSRAFKQAGSFPYYCQIHGALLMHGDIHVPMRAVPTHGTRSTSFSIRVATVAASSGFAYVIQRKGPGGTFKTWRTITGKATTFHTTKAGKWTFRVRVKRNSNGSHSDWSPKLVVKVAP